MYMYNIHIHIIKAVAAKEVVVLHAYKCGWAREQCRGRKGVGSMKSIHHSSMYGLMGGDTPQHTHVR